MKYSRFDNRIDGDALEKMLWSAAKHDKEAGFKYYCRATMWQKASELQPAANDLKDLSDADYLECLQKTDMQFQNKSAQRDNWRVEPFQGPQNIEERC